ncbi:MAG: hypothetical protein R3F62_13525 [Planctomycetota bacterium]
MKIWFRKRSPTTHALRVRRADGSEEARELDTRSFLRHDLVHLAVELEVPYHAGYWGSVAAGGSLSGGAFSGELAEAERLVGPLQTLAREGAPVARYAAVLARVLGERGTPELAARIHARLRSLLGHWRGTLCGEAMQVEWACL